jgi:hypothetical protein
MTDEDFVQQIEACTLPKEAFTHRNHLRLAWLYLSDRQNGAPEDRIAETIQRYAASLGATRKYSHSLTMTWMGLVDAAMKVTPASSFEVFIAAHAELLDPGAAKATPYVRSDARGGT